MHGAEDHHVFEAEERRWSEVGAFGLRSDNRHNAFRHLFVTIIMLNALFSRLRTFSSRAVSHEPIHLFLRPEQLLSDRYTILEQLGRGQHSPRTEMCMRISLICPEM